MPKTGHCGYIRLCVESFKLIKGKLITLNKRLKHILFQDREYYPLPYKEEEHILAYCM